MSDTAEGRAIEAEGVTEPGDEADNLSRAGALQLAARLDAFWHAQGAATVRHWVVAARGRASDRAVFVVRSNLVRGNPPR